MADACTRRSGHCLSPQMEVPSNEGRAFRLYSQYNPPCWPKRYGERCRMDVRKISPLANSDAWRWCLLACFTLAGQALAPAGVFSAGLYRCVDGMGQSVYTDRLAQMTQCVPLSVESPAASPLPASSAPTPSGPASAELSLATRLVPPEQLATSSEAGIVIPLRRIGQLYVVPVELNGTRTAHLIVDTGASHTILSQELVRELALLPSDFRSGLVVLKTAGGSVDAQVVRIDSMKIATEEVRNTSVAVHTVPDFPAGVDGLLGLSFLHEFEVTLDTAKGELRLRRGQP